AGAADAAGAAVAVGATVAGAPAAAVVPVVPAEGAPQALKATSAAAPLTALRNSRRLTRRSADPPSPPLLSDIGYLLAQTPAAGLQNRTLLYRGQSVAAHRR